MARALAHLLLLLSLSAGASAARFDVEVMLLKPLGATAETEERLAPDPFPALPAQAVRFDPPRPTTPWALNTLWQSLEAAPELMRVSPGFPATLDEFFSALAMLRSEPSKALQHLEGLADLRPSVAAGPPRPLPFFRPPRGRAVPARGLQRAPALSGNLALSEAQSSPTTAARYLTARELRLGGARRTLARSAEFRVLGHFGWRTNLMEDEPSAPLALWFPEEAAIPGLVGGLAIDLRRFLHLSGTLYLQEEEGWLPVPLARRMRSEELHHLDHPRLSVLVEVRPVEEDAP